MWLWIIALILAIPTYGISIIVALVLTFLSAKKETERQIVASFLLNVAMASVIADEHRKKFRYRNSVFDNLSDSDFVILIQEIHRRLRVEIQAKIIGKYGKNINELIVNQRQGEAVINMMCNGVDLVLKMCEDNNNANIPGNYLLHEIATAIADKIYENYLRL